MKRLKFHRAIVAIAMMLIGWLPSLAHDFEVDGIYYELINKTNKTVAVTYKGEDSYDYPNEYAGNIVIPSSVKYNGTTYSVTSIGDDAFSGCDSLTSIQIPNSVTSIGSSAFSSCDSLTSIQIPNSVTSIGDYAFFHCSSLTSIQIPNSVTSIGSSVFSSCDSLTSIQIPNSVTSIGDYAFNYCSSLTSIEIPNSVTSIGKLAFSSCKSLISIVVDAGNTKYDSRNGCNAIIKTASNTLVAGCQNTIIPNSVTSIGKLAFSSCDSLTSIQIPNSVTSIGDDAFSHCSSLTSAVIGNSVTSIGKYAFAYCDSLTSIEIPNSVTSIGDDAFSGCDSLTSIVVDSGNTKYDSRNGCNAIIETASNTLIAGCQNTIIPNSVTSIGDDAFAECDSLTSIEIPNSVTSIGNKAFEGCSSLTSIEIGNSVTSIGKYAFEYCKSLTSVVWNAIKCSDFYSNNIPFTNCPNITSFTFGDEVEYIPEYLCYNLSGLTSIEIPNSVTSIGKLAFYGCSSLTSVVWNAKKCSDFTGSKNSPFKNSTNITSFTFGDSAEHIPAYLCYEMSKLTSIKIPNSVTSIGSSTFQGCSGLTNVVWNAKKCSDFTSSENRPFIDSENTSFTFGDSVEHIPAYLCYGMSGLTNIEIPNSVISIGESAFSNGERLIIAVLGNSLTSIEKDAFKGCDNIKKIESKATKAPTIENEDQFSENVYTNADLFVPIGYEDNYKYAYAWSEFHNIKGKDFSVKATTISLDKNEVSLKPTQTVVLTETIQPYDTSNKKVTWSSSDDNIAKVDTNGLVTAIAVGEATITATTTDGTNLSATCKVTVVPTLAETITLDKTEISIEATETATLVATVLPELTTNKSVEWTSSDESVATVDENGVVTAIAVGEATITATTNDGSNLSASCKVTVVPTLAVSIELNQTEASVEEKTDLQLTATILPEHTTNKEVAWSSSDIQVASVDNTGLVTMYSAGEVIITATTTDGSNLSATCCINVYSGIDGVNGDNVIVATIGDNIVVKNAKLGSVVNVYSSNGALIKSMTATDGSVVIEAPIKGIYVITIDGKSFKVMVK